MRYDDASHTAAADHSAPIARPDVDTLAPGSYGPATGNAITGEGTTSGASGADSATAPTIVAVQGAGGEGVVANGAYQVAGEYGALSIDTHGNFNYVRNAGTPDGVKDVFHYTLADASGADASTTLTIDIGQVAAAAAGQGIVSLPAGVELSDIHVNGRDLVVNMPDGSQMVIPNGAVFVPQIVIGDVQVPPTNVAALLIDSEPQPAAGPPQSSGGNFADVVPPLDPGVGLGDLIPPTELSYTPPQFEQINQGIDRQPTVIIETPDNPAGAIDASESVAEKGLPARAGNQPAGSGEIADGNPTNDSDSSETNSGTIVFVAQDGLDSVAINGAAVTAVGQHIAGQYGTITITGIDLASGQIAYSYTLATNTSGNATQDVFNVVVTDRDGDTANASLTVHIVDDSPTAVNDADLADFVTHIAAGNVITGADTTSGAAGADTVGADNASISAISGAGGSDSSFDASGNLVVQGQFGSVSIKADGSYTYTANHGIPGGSVDTFTYTLTDGDGDSSQATLTITNPDHTPTITIQTPDNATPEVNASESVSEKGLGPRGTEPAGSGELADHDPNNNSDTSETKGGTILFDSADGVSGVTINGTAVSSVGQHIDGASGTLTITSIDLANGQIGYSYTLTDNTSGDSTHDDFTVVVSDLDHDSATATLTVHIIDDTPTAHPDTNSVAEGASVSGNVETNDVPGADGFAAGGGITGVVAGDHSSSTVTGGVGTVIHGAHGDLVLNANGSYTYTSTANSVSANTTDTFTYTMTDGDGDTSTTTLVININDVTLHATDNDAIVNEAGLPAGTAAGSGSNIDSNGQITVSGGTGPYTYTLTSSATGAHGTLTLNAATGHYSYTLTSAVDEGNVDNGTDTVTNADHFNYTVTDAHGNTVTSGVINVDIIDDVPVATNDGNLATLDDNAAGVVIGTVASLTGNDHFGADGQGSPAVTIATGSLGGAITIDGSGNLVYTSNHNTPANGSDVETFTYTITDGDGDTAHATFTVTLTDNGPGAGGTVSLSLSEAALDTIQGGSDLAPGTATGTNPASTAETDVVAPASGLSFAAGSDALSSVAFNPVQSGITVGGLEAGYSISWSISGGKLVGTLMHGATDLGTAVIVALTGDTGSTAANTTAQVGVTATLVGPLADTGNSVTINGIDVVATQVDNDQSHGTVNISVSDDAPIATDDGNRATLDDNAAGVNIGTVAGLLANDNFGADGPAASGSVVIGTGSLGGTVTIDGSGNLIYTSGHNTAPGGSDVETFTYTIKDGDGDTAHATFTVTLTDTAPGAGGTVSLSLSEAALDLTQSGSDLAAGTATGTNPGSTAETDVVAPANGLSFAAGSDALNSVAFNATQSSISVAGLSAGYSLSWSINGSGELVGTLHGPGNTNLGTAVIVELTGDTGSTAANTTAHVGVTATLVGPLADTGSSVTINGIDVVATQTDNDTSHGAVNITVTDDAPVATSDGNLATLDDSSAGVVIGTVAGITGNDDYGADGKGSPAITIGTGSLGGTITIDGTGHLVYTSGHNTAPGGSDVETFTYTIKDGDGDTATASFTVTLTDTAPGAGGTVSLSVDESALDTTMGGSDLAAGIATGTNPGSPTETDVLAPASGLSFAANSDALSSVAFNTVQSGITISGIEAGYSLSWSVVSGELVGTLHGPGNTNLGTAVILQLTGDTGSTAAGGTAQVGVTATLVGPLADTGADVTINGIDVVATQVDSDTSHGTVNLTVTDDAPVATNDGLLATVDDTAAGVIIGSVATITGNDDFGADGPGSTAVTIAQGSLGGTVTIDGSGNLVYTSAHNTAAGATDTETFTYTIHDGDGDTSTATFTVDLTDTGPGAGGNVSLQLDEAALDTTKDPNDLAAGTVTGTDPSSPNETQVVAPANGLSFSTGSDALTSVAFDSAQAGIHVSGLESGYSLTWAVNGSGELVGTLHGPGNTNLGTAIIVELTGDTGSTAANSTAQVGVTATLVGPLEHDYPPVNGPVTITGIDVVATQTDNDKSHGSISISVTDDTPQATDDGNLATLDDSSAGVQIGTVAGITGNDHYGADGQGAAVTIGTGSLGGSVTIDGSGNLIYTSNHNTTPGNSDVETFTYTITDGDGDTSTATFSVTLTDTAPGPGGTVSLSLDEAALDTTQAGSDLAAGTATGTNPGSPDETDVVAPASGLSFGANSDALSSVAFNTTQSGITVTGLDASEHLSWAVVGGQLVGTLMDAGNNSLGTAVIVALTGDTGATAAGGTAQVGVTATLVGPLADSGSQVVINGIDVIATQVDSDISHGTVNITVTDDAPIANNDGNLATLDDNVANHDLGAVSTLLLGNDKYGADGQGSPAITIGTGDKGGTVTIDGSGHLIYTSHDNVAPGGSDIETFTYTIKDGDGDTSTATFTVTLTDTGPSISPVAASIAVDEDGLPNGLAGTVYTDGSDLAGQATSQSGNLAGLDYGTDTPGNIALAASADTGLRTIAGDVVKSAWDATTHTLTGFVDSNNNGTVDAGETKVFTLQIDDVSTGHYQFDLLAPVKHPVANTEDDKTFSVAVTVTDSEGDQAAPSQINILIDDDSPVAQTSAGGVGSVTLDESAAGTDTAGASSPSGVASATIDLSAGFVTGASILYGADGANATSPVSYALQLNGSNVASGLYALDNTDIQDVAGDGDGYGKGDQILLNQSGNVITGSVNNVTYFTITIDPATGIATFEQLHNIWNPVAGSTAAALDDTATLTTAAASDIKVVQTVTDGDGDTATASVNLGSGVFQIQDDGPTTFNPQDPTLLNAPGAPVSFALDPAANGGDGIILDNFGTDGAGLVRFPSTIDNTNSGMTSAGDTIWYILSADGQTLLGKTGVDAATAEASGTTIFTIHIDQSTSSYTVDMDGTVDNFTNINFTDTNFDFIGGNAGWFGIVPNGEVKNPVDDNSHDVLITPLNNTSINTSGILGGVDTGQDVGPGEGFRIDYVIDLTGSPPNNYTNGAVNNQSFDSHWTTNGASVTYRQSNGSDIKISAFDDNSATGTDGNDIVGDGVQDTIDKIVIKYAADATHSYTSGNLIPTSTVQSVTLDGVTFTYKLDTDGKSVIVTNVQGANGNNDTPATTVAVFTSTGYTSLEITNVDTTDSFKFAGFGAAVPTGTPVHFSLPVQIVDADGDSVAASSTIDVTLNPATIPLALDLNHDGQVSFLDRSAGVTYDYGHGSVATAWVGPQDGLLVLDANHNGTVDNASEFVFGGAGQTDLQALAAYDSNHDGQLNAADAVFASLAVWQDANSNGKVDAGELTSLMARGITSISLSSDSVSYNAAAGDVAVAGNGSFTWANGAKGILADAAFATGARTAADEVRTTSTSGTNLTVIAALAAAGLSSASASVAETHAESQTDGQALAAITTAHDGAAPPASGAGTNLAEPQDLLGNTQTHDSAQAQAQGSTGSVHDEVLSKEPLGAGGEPQGQAPAELLHGSAAPEHADAGSTASVTAASVAMPSAEQLVAAFARNAATNPQGQSVAGGNATEHNQVVGKVLVDSLNGGESHGPSIDALLDAGHSGGHGIDVLEALASHVGGSAPFGHMAFAGALGAQHAMLSVEMAMHQDAAPPAHG